MAKLISSRLQNIRSIYDARAPAYDHETGPDGFDPRQAVDYTKWASPSPGSNLLDLACGTGAVTIPCARLVGPSGTVTGIDISPASLEIAKGKAEKEGLTNVKFIEGDIVNLKWAEGEGVKEGVFDVITCASAFVLLEDQAGAVKCWAKLLKKGGQLIFDVPTENSMVKGLALERIAGQIGVARSYTRGGLDSEQKVRALLIDAGLDDSEFFVSGSYENGELITVEGVGKTFDEMVAEKKWFRGWYPEMEKPGMLEQVKDLFCKEIEKLADGEGKLRDWLKFYMAVGRKKE